jgi:hypothetical protein
VALLPTDKIVGPKRGSVERALSFGRAIGADRIAELEAYLDEAYRLAPRIGIDPAILVAQSALETNNWRDRWWNERLNPAGIGITGDPDQNEQSMRWDSGTDAARGQLVHLALYALGKPLPRELEPHLHLDPRRDAIPPENLGRARTIAGLGGTWAVVLDYGQRISNRARDVYPELPDQQEEPHMGLEIEVDIAHNRIGAQLREREAWITVHENGNPDSDARDEREFVKNGGGDKKVAYHFAVDRNRAVQILPLNCRGKHAGNTDGNATSIAIETSQMEPDTANNQTQENLRALVAAIITRDERIEFGDGEFEFSHQRMKAHREWAGANPRCPERMLAAWENTIDPLREAVRDAIGRGPIGPIADVQPHPVEGPHETKIVNGHLLWSIDDHLVAPTDILAKEWADPSSRDAPAATMFPAGQVVDLDYVLVGADHAPWLITRQGWRIPAQAFSR